MRSSPRRVPCAGAANISERVGGMTERGRRDDRPVVIVVGCDDIGSAIARGLHVGGAAVVLIDEADPPWPRRGMSYADAWYVGGATLADVDACFCASVKSIPAVLDRGDTIVATTWSLHGVAVALQPIAFVDSRAIARTPSFASRGARVLAGQTLAEIDESGDPSRCFGIAPEAQAAAPTVLCTLGRRLRGSRSGTVPESSAAREFADCRP